jgi:hypothetical protein
VKCSTYVSRMDLTMSNGDIQREETISASLQVQATPHDERFDTTHT